MSERPVKDSDEPKAGTGRSNSFSQQSEVSTNSQTAAEFIREQELLEADAREALPYSIENCTNILGSLRQNVFACLTCNPPPKGPSDTWVPAGVCYACSVQCHGEHTLVEIFQKRNFTCDCGTTRIPSTSPCTLRTNKETNTRGGVHSEEPDANNKYNQNFSNRFCGCECDYDPFQQKGTMFQCLGLGTKETGGCGEDWYHPGCLVGMGPKWYESMTAPKVNPSDSKQLPSISESAEDEKRVNEDEEAVIDDDDDPPMPPGFPEEDDFEGFLCYKCIDANPWIKRYAGTSGFLPPVFLEQQNSNLQPEASDVVSRKRKAEDDEVEVQVESKRAKSEPQDAKTLAKVDVQDAALAPSDCKLRNLPAPPTGRFSLFFKEDFRDKFCRCSACYPNLDANPQLLEEEEVYEPPLSANGDGAGSQHGGSTAGSGSLLERGESALRNVDRVRAIEGVMAYNHLKEQLKPFFQKFAESGQAVGAEDIKAYFAKLRGDEDAIKEAGEAAASSSSKKDDDNDHRKEQSGF